MTKALRLKPHELDIRECEIVSDMGLLSVLAELKAPRHFVPSGEGGPAFYARRSDVKAARTLLQLAEDELESQPRRVQGRKAQDDE